MHLYLYIYMYIDIYIYMYEDLLRVCVDCKMQDVYTVGKTKLSIRAIAVSSHEALDFKNVSP